jgi:prepilin peptidase CpaA
MTIPNWISLALIPAFFLAAWLSGLGLLATGAHVAAGLVALVVAVGLFALGLVGGGDAKLLAAAGLWLGPQAATPFLFWTAVAGGLLALALLASRRAPATAVARAPAWARRLLTPREGIPYGVAIAAGAMAALSHAGLAGVGHGGV